ncbi:hypothetical protein [Acinetobacter stercoris]|uniref:Uncharacterized protein n=1 Tax=Acinetobacter stercoris TaxID=2126983 RepID=A0A2U3N099_9GAMM|nr:hypothetical protein [Acinetobacter stercoris]SPL71092.1 hypothetical protein KPC_2270 [Acinetobacter stercoris]
MQQSPVNLETSRSGGDRTVGFYKLGLDAELELNANIKKLQLGCGGVNGAGCDIDIDNLALSGVSDSSNGRASSSALLTNPFIQFAIKNPNSVATRQVVGLRASAESIRGMLTFGEENTSERNGINSLSGYMEVAAAGGTVNVNQLNNLTYTQTQTPITGNAKGLVLTLPISSNNYSINLNPSLGGTLVLPQQVITGHRISSAPLSATAIVSGIQLAGNIKVNASGINLDKNLAGTVNNLKVNVGIDEDLGYFHKANLNGTSASLSLQSQNIMWPGTKSTAHSGWWLELSNPIEIGDITPSKGVDIALPTIKETLAQVSNYITANPVQCGVFLTSCLLGSTINVGNIDLKNAPAVNMQLNNLQLKNQSFAPNCYGGIKFC